MKRTKLTESQPDSKKEDSSSEMREMFPETIDMQRLLRMYYEQLHPNKLDNPKEKDTFPETYNLLRLNSKETDI